MSSTQEYVEYLKNEVYSNKYFDIFPLSNAVSNPLANVVPLPGADIFGSKVCNIIVFTGQYKDFDISAVNASKARIIECFDQFAKYETHMILDHTAPNVQCMFSGSSWSDMRAAIGDICRELVAYGFSFHDTLSDSAVQESIDQIINNFYHPNI